MKYSKIIIAVIFSMILNVNTYAQSSWYWQNPMPLGNELNEVRFLNENTGIAVGNKGTLLKTTNGGLNWRILSAKTNSNLYNFYFLNSDMIIVVGDKGTIVTSSNGGETWSSEIINLNVNLTGICFTNSDIGWISGFDNSLQKGKIYQTSNGGINWILNFTSPNDDKLTKIKFINEKSGWAGGGWTLFNTTNGGINWNIVNNYTFANDFTFKDSLNGILAGGYFSSSLPYGVIRKTTNGGINFANFFEYRDTTLNSVYFCDSLTGFISGNKGKILRTTNYGDNWITLTNNFNTDLNSIFFQNSSTGWSVGKGGTILKTEDNGISWSHISSSNTSNIYDGQFVNSNTAYLTGQENVLKTTNGGSNWLNIWDSIDVSGKYIIVYFKNENEGWLISPKYNYIYKTMDGGTNWTLVGIYSVGGYNYTPRALYFVNDQKGFMVGQVIYYTPPGIQHISAFLLGTADGGSHWSIITLPFSSGSELNDIKFLNSNTGLIVGSYSRIVRTTDGGNTWFNGVSLFDNFTYRKIDFINENTGWLLGKISGSSVNNMICKTTNAGEVWSNVTGEIIQRMYDIDFSNDNYGWMCGDSGLIYASSNGGLNWIRQESPTDNNLYFINFSNSDTGWVAGNFGTILKTNSGLDPVSVNNLNESFINNFSLSQNYPNPFNPSTNLEFGISELGFVSLKVYDALGKEVATIVNEVLSPGNYNYQFSTVNYQLPSGVYFYKLESGGFVETKRMVLLK